MTGLYAIELLVLCDNAILAATCSRFARAREKARDVLSEQHEVIATASMIRPDDLHLTAPDCRHFSAISLCGRRCCSRM